MRTRSVPTLAGVVVLVALASVSLLASDFLGVYCVVNKVVMAPDETHPNTIQIWGACSIAVGGMQEDHTYTTPWYTEPQPGYMYYIVPADKHDVAINEWKDLKSVAGTGQVVGFGGRYVRNGRMRWPDEKPTNPDLYPIQMGVIKVSTANMRGYGIDYAAAPYADLFTAIRKAAGVK